MKGSFSSSHNPMSASASTRKGGAKASYGAGQSMMGLMGQSFGNMINH